MQPGILWSILLGFYSFLQSLRGWYWRAGSHGRTDDLLIGRRGWTGARRSTKFGVFEGRLQAKSAPRRPLACINLFQIDWSLPAPGMMSDGPSSISLAAVPVSGLLVVGLTWRSRQMEPVCLSWQIFVNRKKGTFSLNTVIKEPLSREKNYIRITILTYRMQYCCKIRVDHTPQSRAAWWGSCSGGKDCLVENKTDV